MANSDRQFFNNYKNDKQQLHNIAEDILAKEYGKVNLKQLNHTNLNDKYKPFIVTTDFDITSLATISNQELTVPYKYSSNLINQFASLSPDMRKYPVVIQRNNDVFRRIMTYHAPKDYLWQSDTLDDVSIDTRFGKYSRKTRIDNEKLVLDEQLTLLPQYIDLKDYAEFRMFCLAVDEAQRIVLRAKQRESHSILLAP